MCVVKEKKVPIVLCAWGIVFILTLIWSIFRIIKPLQIWNFTKDELEVAEQGIEFEANIINENSPGWYIDSSLGEVKSFIKTPPVDLGVGSYDITIYYQGEGDSAKYSLICDEMTYRIMLGRDGELLEPTKKDKCLEVKYWENIHDFQIEIAYGGSGYLIVSEISIHQTRSLETAVLFGVFLIGIFISGILWLKNKGVETKIIVGGIVAVVIASLPLGMPYLYRGDDLYFHLQRIEGIAVGLRNGEIPVRIQSNWMNGYGYPVSVFYSDGILWIAGVFRLLGFSLQSAYKCYVIIINGITFAISYFTIRRLFKNEQIALVGSVIYLLAPYRLVDIYERAAVGEYTALTFLPLVFVGTYEILFANIKKRNAFWILSAGITGILQCHLLTVEMVVIILAVTCIICWKRTFQKDRLFNFLKAIGVTVVINMWFLVPLLDYMREDFKISSIEFGHPIQTNGIFLNQLLSLFPHGGGQEASIVEGLEMGAELSFSIGITFIGILLIYSFKRKSIKNDSKEKTIGEYGFWSACILLAMSTIWFPWDWLYRNSEIARLLITRLQFPWRVLGIGGLMITIAGCAILSSWKTEKNDKIFMCTAVVFLISAAFSAEFYNSSLLQVNNKVYVPDEETIGTFNVIGGEYLPEEVIMKDSLMPEKKIIAEEEIQIIGSEKKGTGYRVEVFNRADKVKYLELPMLYYRGYVAKDEETKEEILLEKGENGRIRLLLAGGYSGRIKVNFEEPTLWKLSEVVTLISIVWGLLYYLKKEMINGRYGKKKEKNAEEYK